MSKKIIVVAVALLFWMALCGAVEIGFQKSSERTLSGGSIGLEVDVNASKGIYAYSFDIYYNNSVFRFKEANFSDFIDGYSDVRIREDKLTVMETKFKEKNGSEGSQELVEIIFNIENMTGDYYIEIKNVQAVDYNGQRLEGVAIGEGRREILIAKYRGDANRDGKVDIIDLAAIGRNYNSEDWESDLNGDGEVDIMDLAIVGQEYGKD